MSERVDDSYAARVARQWANRDPMQRWIDAAPDGPSSIAETVRDYLEQHNPFPDDWPVEVASREESGAWVPATVLERVGVDEWAVEYDDGDVAWRDHHELRPRGSATVDP